MIKHKINDKFINWLKQFGGFPLPDWSNIVNIVGIRNNSDKDKDIFNDTILLIDDKNIYAFKSTTDPGKFWTKNPIKETSGVANLLEGWYPNVYQIGIHRGEKALVQSGAPVTVWRDVDKNFEYDADVDNVQTGYFGINLHHAYGNPEHIGRWSAGCQVIQDWQDRVLFINLIESYPVHSYNYLLLNTNDIDDKFKNYIIA